MVPSPLPLLTPLSLDFYPGAHDTPSPRHPPPTRHPSPRSPWAQAGVSGRPSLWRGWALLSHSGFLFGYSKDFEEINRDHFTPFILWQIHTAKHCCFQNVWAAEQRRINSQAAPSRLVLHLHIRSFFFFLFFFYPVQSNQSEKTHACVHTFISHPGHLLGPAAGPS